MVCLENIGNHAVGHHFTVFFPVTSILVGTFVFIPKRAVGEKKYQENKVGVGHDIGKQRRYGPEKS